MKEKEERKSGREEARQKERAFFHKGNFYVAQHLQVLQWSITTVTHTLHELVYSGCTFA
jgi:hypothetical protein